MAEAQRAVDKNLDLDGGVGGDESDLVESELPCKHDAGDAHLGCGVNAPEVVHAHLSAGVKGQVGTYGAEHHSNAEVLNDYGVNTGFGDKASHPGNGLHLPVGGESVEGDIHLAAALAAISDGIEKFLLCEVFCAASGVEVAETQINGVGAALHSGNDRLGASGGREKFKHLYLPLYIA